MIRNVQLTVAVSWFGSITVTTRCGVSLMQHPCRVEMKALRCSTLPPCLHLLSIPPPPLQHQGVRIGGG